MKIIIFIFIIWLEKELGIGLREEFIVLFGYIEFLEDINI